MQQFKVPERWRVGILARTPTTERQPEPKDKPADAPVGRGGDPLMPGNLKKKHRSGLSMALRRSPMETLRALRGHRLTPQAAALQQRAAKFRADFESMKARGGGFADAGRLHLAFNKFVDESMECKRAGLHDPHLTEEIVQLGAEIRVAWLAQCEEARATGADAGAKTPGAPAGLTRGTAKVATPAAARAPMASGRTNQVSAQEAPATAGPKKKTMPRRTSSTEVILAHKIQEVERQLDFYRKTPQKNKEKELGQVVANFHELSQLFLGWDRKIKSIEDDSTRHAAHESVRKKAALIVEVGNIIEMEQDLAAGRLTGHRDRDSRPTRSPVKNVVSEMTRIDTAFSKHLAAKKIQGAEIRQLSVDFDRLKAYVGLLASNSIPLEADVAESLEKFSARLKAHDEAQQELLRQKQAQGSGSLSASLLSLLPFGLASSSPTVGPADDGRQGHDAP